MTGTVTKGKAIREDLNLYDGVNATVSRTDSTGGTTTGQPIGDVVDVLQVYGDGSTRDDAAIQNAIDSLGSANRGISLSPGTWTISNDVTVPANITLFVQPGAIITPDSGKTFTISGTLIRFHTTYTGGDGDVTLTDGIIDLLATQVNATLGANTFSGNQTIQAAASPRFRAEDSTNTVQADLQANDSAGVVGTNSNHPLDIYTNATSRGRVDTSGRLLWGGTTAQTTSRTAAVQILGATQNASTLLLGHWSTTDANNAAIHFLKSGNATIGSNTIVAANEQIGAITALGDDGGDYATPATNISFEIDGTPGTNDMPGRIVFETTADGAASVTERMRIDSAGNVYIGGSTLPTSSAGNIVLFNGTAPTAGVANGITLYAEDVSSSSELKVMDEAGNSSTLSPHNFSMFTPDPAEPYPWSMYHKNAYIGKEMGVDMAKLCRLVEGLTGEQIIYERDIPKRDINQEKQQRIDAVIEQNRKTFALVDKKGEPIKETDQEVLARIGDPLKPLPQWMVDRGIDWE